jgi:hypothetical protein
MTASPAPKAAPVQVLLQFLNRLDGRQDKQFDLRRTALPLV